MCKQVADLAARQRLVSARAEAELAGVLVRAAAGKARAEAPAREDAPRAGARGCPG